MVFVAGVREESEVWSCDGKQLRPTGDPDVISGTAICVCRMRHPCTVPGRAFFFRYSRTGCLIFFFFTSFPFPTMNI